MKKRLLSALCGLWMLGTLIGCQGNTSDNSGAVNNSAVGGDTVTTTADGPIHLSLWGEEANFPMLEKMIESFKKEYASEAEFEITLVVQSDATLRDVALGDVHNLGDVFHFPDDQLNSLVAGGILEAVPNADKIKNANAASAVDAASLNGTLFAYPMTADNGYFLYYDKTYLTEEDVKTMDGILAVAEKTGKKLSMEINSGWYMYSFFGNTGLEFGINADGVTNFCNWNTAEAPITGVMVAEAMDAIIKHPGFLATADSNLITNMKEGKVIAAVSGVWNAMDVKNIWGDNYGAVKMPTYTCNGKQLQMASFTGYKMIGVNSYSENLEWAHKLADWITNEENQTLRFVERNQGPSNIKAAASDEVLKVPAIQAVMAQAQHGRLQRVGNNYWGACTKFADTLIAGNKENKTLQELLDILVTEITASTVK